MKTAEEWRIEFKHMSTKPVHKQFFEQGVIEAIQLDAYKAGMTEAASVAFAHKGCVRTEARILQARDNKKEV